MEISGRSERLYSIADKSFHMTIFWQPHLLILFPRRVKGLVGMFLNEGKSASEDNRAANSVKGNVGSFSHQTLTVGSKGKNRFWG